jgi:hypothetical protein
MATSALEITKITTLSTIEMTISASPQKVNSSTINENAAPILAAIKV